MNPQLIKLALQGAMKTKSMVDSYHDQTVKGNSMAGNYDSGTNLLRLFSLGAYTSRIDINYNDARRIDSFFTRYGYAQNKVMQPNTAARKYYTYLQVGDDCYQNSHGTSARNLGMGANAQQIDQINDLLKNGVTFWKRTIDYNTIFKYQLMDNDVVED